MKNKSPIPVLIKTQSPSRRKILKDSCIAGYEIRDKSIVDDLLSNRFIRSGEKPGEYLITPKGIWHYENEKKIFGLEYFLDFIDKNYFDMFKGTRKSFDAKEKIVIFTMIAIRAFLNNNPIDLNVDHETINKWNEIFDKSRKMLLDLNVINQSEYDNFWKEDIKNDEIQNAVYYLMRHMNSLSEKTNDIYITLKKKKYYLNISKKEDLMVEELKFLLRKVFEGIELSMVIKENIFEFLKSISFNYSIYVFHDSNEFSNPKFNNIIKDILYSL